ncbi:MAG: oligosaccharide flippase family protein [Methylovirgula sp.]
MSIETDTFKPLSDGVPSLKLRVFRAGSWVLFGHIAAQIIRLASNLVMTRLLAPNVFGIMAVASVVHVVISLLADIGLRQAVIQSPNGANRAFLNTAWTLQVLQGWWIWVLCAAAALGLHIAGTRGLFPADSVYATPILPVILTVISFTAIIRGFQSMKVCAVNRNLDLKRVTQLELFSSIVSLLVTALLGWMTHSIWSFVAGTLVGSAMTMLLSHFWFAGPTDRFQWNRKALRELLHFGKWIVISSALGIVATNGDRLLLADWFSPTALGQYSIALNLAMVLDAGASRLFSSVCMPAMSEIVRQGPDRLPALYFRMRWISDAAFVGMAGFLFAAAEWIVRFLYDARYASAGAMLQILSFALLFSRYGLTQNAYLAIGRPSYITALNFVRLVSLFIMVPGLFYLFGIRGAIAGTVFYQLPAIIVMLWFNRRHGLNSVVHELLALCVWPLGWGAGTAFVSMVRLLPIVRF